MVKAKVQHVTASQHITLLRRPSNMTRESECTMLVLATLLALPPALLPSYSGMSLVNLYVTVGTPLSTELTIYGPGSGISGLSQLPLPTLLLNVGFWFVIARLSFAAWHWALANKPTGLRAITAAAVCTLWSAVHGCFVLGLSRCLLEWHWQTCTDTWAFYRSVRLAATAFPFFCIAVYSVPFVCQIPFSRRYPLGMRIACCATPLVMVTLTSLALQHHTWGNQDGFIPAVFPVRYFVGTGTCLSEMAGQAKERSRQIQPPHTRADHDAPQPAAGD